MAIFILLAILGYVLGSPVEARAAPPKCTKANPCTVKEAAVLKRLGEIARVTRESATITLIASAKGSCRTHVVRRTFHSPAGPTLLWGELTKTWCYNKKGFITFMPKAKVQTKVTGFGNAVGYREVKTEDAIDQRYPWRNDPRRGSWSWRSMTARQEVPVVSFGIFHLRTSSFTLSIRAHGDGTATDNAD